MPAITPEMGKPTHARTVTKRRDHLSFIVDTFGPRGAHKDTAHFRPEVGTLWSTGHLAGIAAARDLIRALRNADDALSLASLRWQSTSVIRDAAAAAANRKDGEAMQAAGDAFIQQIAEALKFAAKHGAFDAYFDARIAEAEQTHERVLQENKRRTERSIAARRSKLRTQIGGAA